MNKCKHCKGDLAIRNPSGFCDHLYYPENCKVCSHTPQPPQENDCAVCKEKIEDGTTYWNLKVHPNCGYPIKYSLSQKESLLQEIRGKVEDLKWGEDCPGNKVANCEFHQGYNQAVDHLNKLLKELK